MAGVDVGEEGHAETKRPRSYWGNRGEVSTFGGPAGREVGRLKQLQTEIDLLRPLHDRLIGYHEQLTDMRLELERKDMAEEAKNPEPTTTTPSVAASALGFDATGCWWRSDGTQSQGDPATSLDDDCYGESARASAACRLSR